MRAAERGLTTNGATVRGYGAAVGSGVTGWVTLDWSGVGESWLLAPGSTTDVEAAATSVVRLEPVADSSSD